VFPYGATGAVNEGGAEHLYC